MRKIVVLGAVAAVLFGLSYAASWMLQKSKKDGEKEKEKAAEPGSLAELGPVAAEKGPTLSLDDPPKAATRPGYNKDADGPAQLAKSLEERTATLKDRERRLTERQKLLDLVYQDIKSERAYIEDLQKQVNATIQSAGDKLSAVEGRFTELAQREEKTTKELQKIEGTRIGFEKEEQDRIKQTATIFGDMPPESTAAILQKMADSGQLDTAVKVLATMKERQAAKVLAEITDPNVAAQLVDKMKTVRKPVAVK